MKHQIITILLICTTSIGSIAAAEVTAPVTVHTIEEQFTTLLEPEANIDSVAVWPAGSDRGALLFATGKATDVVKVYDAASGEELLEIGANGSAQYKRPNGVTVIDDLLIVVERDNRRVHIHSIPDFRQLATFGTDVLIKPYGLWVQGMGNGNYRVFVTDAYEGPGEAVPPNVELGERVKQWRIKVDRAVDGSAVGIESHFEKSFGETSGPGVLRVVESIFGDPLYDRLLIAEEDEMPETGLVIKEYNLDGRFTGTVVGAGIFSSQAEGIALYACPEGSGYWVSTDQAKDRTVFHVFDRETLQHVGAFMGEVTANTDGIWLAATGVPGFEEGAFYAVHDDQAVSAFSWSNIVDALDLQYCK